MKISISEILQQTFYFNFSFSFQQIKTLTILKREWDCRNFELHRIFVDLSKLDLMLTLFEIFDFEDHEKLNAF